MNKSKIKNPRNLVSRHLQVIFNSTRIEIDRNVEENSEQSVWSKVRIKVEGAIEFFMLTERKAKIIRSALEDRMRGCPRFSLAITLRNYKVDNDVPVALRCFPQVWADPEITLPLHASHL